MSNFIDNTNLAKSVLYYKQRMTSDQFRCLFCGFVEFLFLENCYQIRIADPLPKHLRLIGGVVLCNVTKSEPT